MEVQSGSPGKLPVSAAVLIRNEKNSIERCLHSLIWAKEIIVIDNSVDETVTVAQKIIGKRLQVFKEQTEDDFSYLRNLALGKATNEWVLFIDADEVVSESLRDEIEEAIKSTDIDGFYLKRQDFFLGKWLCFGETGNIKLLKLGRKNAGQWRRPVHEVWEIKGKVSELRAPLFHYPHPTIAEFLAHINRWTTLDAQNFYDQGTRSNYLKILIYPIGKFFLNYFIKLGFLDGMPGLIMAMMMSFHSFLTRGKLYLLQIGREP